MWVDSSIENKKVVDDLRILWTESGKLDPQPVAVDANVAWDKVFKRFEDSKNPTKPLIVEKKTKPFYETALKVAAAIIPALLITYFIINRGDEAKQMAIISSANTQQKQMEDGSTITINSHTKLFYPESFDKNIREVSLDGEAFFNISPNNERPFIIHSGNATVKVVGTSFNVKTTENRVEVFVKTGKVMLYSVSKTTSDTISEYLTPGIKGIFDRMSKSIKTKEVTNENDLFWMTKKIEFNKTELAEVIEVLNANYNVKIVLKDENLSRLKLSSTFNNQSIESVLEIISTSLDLELNKSATIYEINGKGK